jgi:L-malate glycosyltransferase
MSIVEADKSILRAGKKSRILVVPGFVVDAYSEIEASFVELCSLKDPDLNFIWLVPDITNPYNRYARPDDRTRLTEPIWLEYLRANGIPYIIGNIAKYDFVSNLCLFARIFREQRVDAVYTHFGFERFWATLLGKLSGKTTIWNEHWHSLGTRFVLPKRLFYRFCVDEFIAVSHYIAGTLPSASRVHVIPNAIRGNKNRPVNANVAEIRRRLGLPADRPMVLMVAEFREDKRPFLALDICRWVLARSPNTIFVFLGGGKLREAFLLRVKGLGLTDNIFAPGHADNVDEYYSAANLTMLTSHYEPFGYCIVEAMAHGIPMVAFNTGGPSEIIRNNDTGILVEEGNVAVFASCLLELLNDDDKRQRLGERAIAVVRETFDRDVWVSNLLRVLKNIVTQIQPA